MVSHQLFFIHSVPSLQQWRGAVMKWQLNTAEFAISARADVTAIRERTVVLTAKLNTLLILEALSHDHFKFGTISSMGRCGKTTSKCLLLFGFVSLARTVIRDIVGVRCYGDLNKKYSKYSKTKYIGGFLMTLFSGKFCRFHSVRQLRVTVDN